MCEGFNATKDSFDIIRMESFLESGEVCRFISALDYFPPSKLVGEAAFKMIFEFNYHGNDSIRAQLVAVPGLLSSLARYCKEEPLLRISQPMVAYISNAAIGLSKKSPARIAALVEAGWADLLINALRARPDDELSVDRASWAISRLLLYSPVDCRTAFISAGAEAALEETLQRYPSGNWSKQCSEALKQLAL